MRILFYSLIFLFNISNFSSAQSSSLNTSPNKSISAKIQGLLIQADTLDRDNENDLVELNGRIQIIYNDYHIQCDKAKIYTRTKKIHLMGRVLMTHSKSTIGGDQVWFDYESSTGLISKGFVQSGNVIFEGDLINKTGETDYYVVNANYTTCNNCPASWSFQGSQIRAELGGYAYIKNSWLKIGAFPILWLPYLIVPLKSDRQTGLLTPYFETSQPGGLTFSQPFFWVISRNQDLTYTFKNYEFRGPKSLFNYRLVINKDSYTELNTGWLHDKVFQNDERVNAFRSDDKKGEGINRWFIKFDQYLQLPNDYIHRTQINNASDLQYPKDFPKESLSNKEPSFENRMSLTKNYETIHSSVDTSYNINLLKSDPLSANDDGVHRTPEIKISKMPEEISNSGFIYNWEFNYLNLSRNGKSYDDLTFDPNSKIRFPTNSCNSPFYDQIPDCKLQQDGKFDPYIDLIRTGQRLEFKPSISYPMNFNDTVDILPKLTFQETQYQFAIRDDSQIYRRYLKGEVGARTQLVRIYSESSEIKSTKYKHEIIPQVVYAKTPWLDRKNHPFWGFDPENLNVPFTSQEGVSDRDLTSPYGLQFDYLDRALDREIVTFSVMQRLTEKRWVDATPTYNQVASLTLSQSYDVYQSSLNTPTKQPWSNLSAYLNVNFNYFTTSSTFNYYPYQKVTNVSSQIKLSNKYGNFFQLGLDKSYQIVPGQDVNINDRTEDYLFRAGLTSKYFNLIGQFIYDGKSTDNSFNRRVKLWAYVSQIKPPGECWLITLAQYQLISGPQEFKISWEFTFDGNSKPPLGLDALSAIIN